SDAVTRNAFRVPLRSGATPRRSAPKLSVCSAPLYALYAWALHSSCRPSRRAILFPLRRQGMVLASRAWSQFRRFSPCVPGRFSSGRDANCARASLEAFALSGASHSQRNRRQICARDGLLRGALEARAFPALDGHLVQNRDSAAPSDLPAYPLSLPGCRRHRCLRRTCQRLSGLRGSAPGADFRGPAGGGQFVLLPLGFGFREGSSQEKTSRSCGAKCGLVSWAPRSGQGTSPSSRGLRRSSSRGLGSGYCRGGGRAPGARTAGCSPSNRGASALCGLCADPRNGGLLRSRDRRRAPSVTTRESTEPWGLVVNE